MMNRTPQCSAVVHQLSYVRFFLQAEDGIRGRDVTGVQTCALPIFNRDLINKSGAGTTTEQLLQRQPVMNGSNIPVNNNGTSQSGPSGSAALALRGLDPGATLEIGRASCRERE